MGLPTVKPLSEAQLADIQDKVSKCSSREEFIANYQEEYKKIRRRRLQGKFLGHFPMKKKKFRTDAELIEIAKKYSSRSEFAANDVNAYYAAINRNILEECCKQMMLINRNFRTPEFREWIVKEVEICKFRINFEVRNPGLYDQIKQRSPELFKTTDKLIKKYFTQTSLGEESLRNYFQILFNTPFKKCRPEWLVNPKTGRKLELDGFSAKMKLAFEHNSNYHIGKEELDETKNKLCKENGIILISFTDLSKIGRTKNASHVQEYVLSKIKECGIDLPLKLENFSWHFLGTNIQWTYEKLKAATEGYTLLKDFRKHEGKAYDIILQRGFKEELLSHLQHSRVIKYEDVFLLQTFFSCLSKKDFKNKYPKLYNSFCKRKSLVKYSETLYCPWNE